MKQYLFGAALAAIAAGGAQAQSVDWSGPYVGGVLGYASGRDEGDETLIFDTDLDGVYGDTVLTTAPADAFSPGSCDGAAQGPTPADGCSDDDDGAEFGARLGYDWQVGSFVFGAVGEYARMDVTDAVSSFSTTPAFYTFSRELNSVAAIRARAGFATGSALLYVTGGFASGDIDYSFDTSNGANAFTVQQEDDRADGHQLGVGGEWRVRDNWSLGLEYLFTSLDAGDYTVRAGDSGTTPATNPFLLDNPDGTDMRRSNEDFEIHAVRLTASYRF